MKIKVYPAVVSPNQRREECLSVVLEYDDSRLESLTKAIAKASCDCHSYVERYNMGWVIFARRFTADVVEDLKIEQVESIIARASELIMRGKFNVREYVFTPTENVLVGTEQNLAPALEK